MHNILKTRAICATLMSWPRRRADVKSVINVRCKSKATWKACPFVTKAGDARYVPHALAETSYQADTYVLRHKLSRARSALPLARYAPDHIADIVRHQKRAVGTECYSYRPSIGLPFVRCEEAR
jgi:hypothetical protein